MSDTPDIPSDSQASLSPEVVARLNDLQQADVIDIDFLPVLGADGQIRHEVLHEGRAVVVTQTCDLVQQGKSTAHVAPLVRLPNTQAKEAREGRRPQYVHVRALGEEYFADLSIIGTLDKEYLVTLPRRAGVRSGENDVSFFGRAVGRRFGRFPFPDDVIPWLSPLKSQVQSKALKPDSPLGKALDSIAELRLEASGGWGSSPPYSLTLIIILKIGTLPTLEDDAVPAENRELHRWLYGDSDAIFRTPAQVAEKLTQTDNSSLRHQLWMGLGEALAALCKPRPGSPQSVFSAVKTPISVDVAVEDEITYDRIRRSEEVDLDHLSAPRSSEYLMDGTSSVTG